MAQTQRDSFIDKACSYSGKTMNSKEHREIIKLIREERDGDFEPLMRRHYRDVVTID